MKKALALLVLAAAIAPVAAAAPAAASEDVEPDVANLTLLNSWTNAPYSTRNAAITIVQGVVHFSGAIASGAVDSEPFKIPAKYRPAARVSLKADQLDSFNGRLIVNPDGTTEVEGANGSGFMSLDGITYTTKVMTDALTLKNGWAAYAGEYGYPDYVPAIENFEGIVRLQGTLSAGTVGEAFKVPAKFRPAATVYIPLDLCGATNGRLEIDTDGTATIEAEAGGIGSAGCFTSLDGAWYALAAEPAITLLNSWTEYGTTSAGVKNIGGIVTFGGAMNGPTTALSGNPFKLPAALRPSAEVYIPLDLCGSVYGRLHIAAATGLVDVEIEEGATVGCDFVSLDGVSFAL